MNKFFRVATIVTLLLVAFSSFALAAKDADLDWGSDMDDSKGNWGFVWTKELDDETSGDLMSRMKYKKDLYNKTVTGPYVEGGQNLSTVFGARLGVNYSPYVASFHKDNEMTGVRVYPYNLNLGLVNLNFDATYIVGHIWKNSKAWFPTVKLSSNDILLGVKGNIWEIDVETALVRYWKDGGEKDGKQVNDYFYNYSVQAELEVIPGLVVNGLYARYTENDTDDHKDFLYEVTAKYDVLPGLLSLRAGHRNSEIDGVVFKKDKNEIDSLPGNIVGGVKNTEAKQRYINDLKPIQTIYNRDNSINVGATVWYDFDIVENVLKVDFDTTNPAKRGDLDDKVTVELDTKVLNFSLWNKASVMFPDDETVASEKDVFDRDKVRLDYGVKFRAKYDLPVPVVNKFTATGMVNFDFDNNYKEENRTQTIAGIELATAVDIFQAKNVGFGAFVFYDVQGGLPADADAKAKVEIADAFKYSLLAKYDAPNGIKFRLEYNSSVDFSNENTSIHGEKLNDRYADFRHYDNSKFNGFRLSVGVPF